MARKRFNLGLGAAALILLASGGFSLADGPVQVGPAGPCCADGACAAEGCCKTCVPAPVEKKVVLRHYGVKCEDFCLCKPTFLGGLLNLQDAMQKDHDLYVGCGPGDQPCSECGGCVNCGQPHIKKYLVIHLRTHTECEIKCQSPDQLAEGQLNIHASAGEHPGPVTPQLNPNR